MPAQERLLTPRFGLIVVVGLLYFLSLGMLLPVVPLFVERSLAGGSVAVGVAVGAFSVGAVLIRPYAGRLGDRYGRRLLIIGGAFIVAVAVAGYHLATAMPVLVGARAVGGIGEAAFFVGAGTMITDLAPEARRGEALSYWSVAVYGGLAFGPFLGEIVLQEDQYARVWTTSAALALAAALLGMLTTETIARASRSGGVAAGESGAPSGDAVRQPLLHRASLAPGLVLFLGLVGLAGFFEFVPLYVHDLGFADSRGIFLLYGGVVLFVRIVGARLPDRLGPLRAGSAATGSAAAGLALVAAVPTAWGLYLGTIIFSLGMSLLYPTLLTLALTGVPPRERGSSVGTVSSFFDASQGIGAALLGGVAAVAGYRGAFAVGAGFAAVGLVVLRGGIDHRTHAIPDPGPRSAAQID
jgi:MFS family permease